MAEVLEKQYTAKKIALKQEMLLDLAREAVATSAADQTLVRINATDSALTRFAGSSIHQNTFERVVQVTAVARVGQQEGKMTTNRLTTAALEEVVGRATAAARMSPPNPDLADLPEGPREYPLQTDYYESTASCTPEERAAKVIKGLDANDDPAFEAAGTLSSNQINMAIVNSNGIEAAFNTTESKYTMLWSGPNSSGYAEDSSRNISDIDTEALSVEALATAKRSANPRNDIPAGKYQVVLGPECLTTMLTFLNWLGFSGKDYLDGSSFLCGKMGEPVGGSYITIIDDPINPRTMGLPCDAAGVPKQRLGIIESGVVRGVAHDTNTAKRAGTVSTGHDTGSDYPLPLNLVLSPGKLAKEDLLKQVDRGIYVSRFHYTNVVDPLQTIITGMTRDGTFLIENGELTDSLTNFRFTQSVIEALRRAWLSTEQVYYGAFWGAGSLVPDMAMVEEFNFSGKTEF